jgi:hypothetical protein
VRRLTDLRLSKLVEKILRQVYTLEDIPEDERLESALRLGKTLEDWKAQLPLLMGGVKPSLLHFTWRRQHNMLQLTHWHAQILIYRPFMTAPYPADRQSRRTTDVAVRTCIEAARMTLAMTTQLARERGERDKSHFHTLLYAHHVTYIAACVVYLIPHFRERQKLFGGGSHKYRPESDVRLTEAANKAVKALVDGTNEYSPARKWAVILDELREEVARQVPMPADQGTEQPNQEDQGPEQASISREGNESPGEQLLEDALRAHWEADLAREGPQNRSANSETPAEPAPIISSRLWDKWKTTDWLDLDSAVSPVVLCLWIGANFASRPLARFPLSRRMLFPSLPDPDPPDCRQHTPG